MIHVFSHVVLNVMCCAYLKVKCSDYCHVVDNVRPVLVPKHFSWPPPWWFLEWFKCTLILTRGLHNNDNNNKKIQDFR